MGSNFNMLTFGMLIYYIYLYFIFLLWGGADLKLLTHSVSLQMKCSFLFGSSSRLDDAD